MIKVGLVGLGKISTPQQMALESIDDVEIVAGVDVDPTRTLSVKNEDRPVYTNVEDLAQHDLDVIIVATPAGSHVQVCRQVVDGTAARRVLVEKPAATSYAEVEDMLALRADLQVDVMYHAAHAPEVVWAVEHFSRWLADWGPVRHCEAYFSDPYGGQAGIAQEKVSSWIDSGINALSVWRRFLLPQRIVDFHTDTTGGDDYQAQLAFESGGEHGNGTIRTTWGVAEPAKRSTFWFSSGAVLTLNHQLVSGYVEQDGSILESFLYTGQLPRLASHYLNTFASLVNNHGDHLNNDDTKLLHRLLFTPNGRVD